jgi:serine/threonine-protein kinase
VSGHVPFEATTMPELCAMVLTEAAPSLREHCPSAPPGLAAAVERCLQKDPSQRFGNVSELANALAPFAPSKSRHSVERISRVLRAAGVNTSSLAPPSDVSAQVPQSAARPGDSTSAAWSPASTGTSRRSSALGAVIAVAVLLVAGTLLLLRRHASADSGVGSASAAAPASAPALTSVSAPASLEVLPMPAPPPAATDSAPSVVPAALPSGSAALAHHAPAAAAKASKTAAPAAAAPVAPAPPAATPTPAPAKKRNPLDIGLK